MYSWATSAPSTAPLFATLTVMEPMLWKLSLWPPGMMGPETTPGLVETLMSSLEYAKVVYAAIWCLLVY